MKKLILLGVLIFLVGISCQAQYDEEADKQALTKLVAEDFDANALSGNHEANAALYTESAKRIQHGHVYKGHEAILNVLSHVREGFVISEHENTVKDFWISENLASVGGIFTGSWVKAEWGDTLLTKQAWVHVCERQTDDSWKIAFTMASELNH